MSMRCARSHVECIICQRFQFYTPCPIYEKLLQVIAPDQDNDCPIASEACKEILVEPPQGCILRGRYNCPFEKEEIKIEN